MDMDYAKMTVAQLREEAEAAGVEIPKGAKKADIVAALEKAGEDAPQVVEAEVIDDTDGIAVSFLAGSIEANFDTLDAKVDEILAGYDGWEPSADSAEDVEQCMRERKYLNGLAKQVDERRKAVKAEYLRPLDAFEARANATRDRIKDAAARLQAVEKEADQARRDAKEAELREHYEAMAGILAEMVPYEGIADPKWLNKTAPLPKCKEQLEDRARKVAADWEALKGMGLAFQEQAELRFFQSLDLGHAVAWAKKLEEDKRRLDGMKSELYGEPEQAPVEPAPMPPQPAPMPAPVPLVPAQPAPTVADQTAETVRKAMAIASGPSEKLPVPCVVVVDSATVEQMRALGMLCGLVGITGTFKMGTLAEVCEREFGGSRG